MTVTLRVSPRSGLDAFEIGLVLGMRDWDWRVRAREARKGKRRIGRCILDGWEEKTKRREMVLRSVVERSPRWTWMMV